MVLSQIQSSGRLAATVLAGLLVAQPATVAASERPSTATPSAETKRIGLCAAGDGSSSLKKNLYKLCYEDHRWQVDEPLNQRFTNRDPVEIQVQHFNHLRFTLTVDIQEQKSEAYQYLTKMFSSGLGASFGSIAGMLGDEPGAAGLAKAKARSILIGDIQRLLRAMGALDATLTRTLGRFKEPGLDAAQVADLKKSLGAEPSLDAAQLADSRKPPGAEPAGASAANTCDELQLSGCSIRQLMAQVTKRFETLEDHVLSDPDVFLLAHGTLGELYTETKKAQAQVTERAAQFEALAQKTLGSDTKRVGKREAGTKVIVVLSAVDGGGAKSSVADINYFVETTMPLVPHGGLTFAGIRDVTFERIKRANGFAEEDLFQKTTDSQANHGLSLFLGWRLANLSSATTPNSAHVKLLLSLGTNIKSPGTNVLVGPSVLFFDRFALTGGVSLGKEKEGQQQTLEPNTFKAVLAKPKTSWFISLTTKVY